MSFSKLPTNILLFATAILLLASCSATPQAPQPQLEITANSSYLKDWANKFLKSYQGDEYRNCVATSFDVPGQGLRAAGSGLRAAGSGLRAAGSVGGLFIHEANSLVKNYSAQDVSNYLKNFADYSASETVGIIVLDQFSFNTGKNRVSAYSVGPDVYTLVDAVSVSEDALENTFTSLRASGQLSHGALVFEHTQEIVDGLPNTTPAWSNRYYKDEKTFYRNGQRIVVKAVDVKDFDTALVASTLEDAIRNLEAKGITKISINMSFSIVPCALSELARDYNNIEAYLENIEAEAEAAGEDFDADSFISQLSWLTARTNDPLLASINTNYGQGIWDRGNVAVIAAAGNYSSSIPLLPALAPDVVSVSSFDFPKYTASSFSNKGEVAAPGWVFRLDNSTKGRLISFAGTSFSSPAVSVYAALDLAQTSPKCFSNNSPSDLLSYGDYSFKKLDDVVARCTP